jgi:hypothetical protein
MITQELTELTGFVEDMQALRRKPIRFGFGDEPDGDRSSIAPVEPGLYPGVNAIRHVPRTL